MKKITVILLALAMVVALPSCKNQNKQQKTEETALPEGMTQQEKLVAEDLKINLQNLVESTKKMKAAPFMSAKGGALKLSEKEKMVKPEYLLDPAEADGLQTLSQKYRAVSMLCIDKAIANLYGMPVDGYDAAIAKLNIAVNDNALKEFSENITTNSEASDLFSKFYEAELNTDRAQFFWEATAAGLVEQVYICSQNIDKFMTMFTDETASEVTYNFVCVHDGLTTIAQNYPEMESLNNALLPLYVINAISVEQLKEQLLELKGEIEVIRAILLK